MNSQKFTYNIFFYILKAVHQIQQRILNLVLDHQNYKISPKNISLHYCSVFTRSNYEFQFHLTTNHDKSCLLIWCFFFRWKNLNFNDGFWNLVSDSVNSLIFCKGFPSCGFTTCTLQIYIPYARHYNPLLI